MYLISLSHQSPFSTFPSLRFYTVYSICWMKTNHDFQHFLKTLIQIIHHAGPCTETLCYKNAFFLFFLFYLYVHWVNIKREKKRYSSRSITISKSTMIPFKDQKYKYKISQLITWAKVFSLKFSQLNNHWNNDKKMFIHIE